MPRRSHEAAFGEVLRDLRLQSDLSQEALAHACDRHRTYISLLERGKHSPSVATLFKLADALATEPSEMLRRVEASLGR